jgi:hypothetical protein
MNPRAVKISDGPMEKPINPQPEETKMNKSRCPHCGVKLGNFLYAEACPHCHEELKQNTAPLIGARKKDPQKAQPWLVRMFFSVVRLVES